MDDGGPIKTIIRGIWTGRERITNLLPPPLPPMNYFYTLVQNNNRIIIELILRFARKLILILEIDHQDFHRKLYLIITIQIII